MKFSIAPLLTVIAGSSLLSLSILALLWVFVIFAPLVAPMVNPVVILLSKSATLPESLRNFFDGDSSVNNQGQKVRVYLLPLPFVELSGEEVPSSHVS